MIERLFICADISFYDLLFVDKSPVIVVKFKGKSRDSKCRLFGAIEQRLPLNFMAANTEF